ncbi:MAG: ABC transporter substrate-binding protein [Candidatus Eiseniibacteriota bacterium]|nr:MAG: ABC transporter substrate-binding protein [Candidatus Eisenbacteria bacterium]
MNVSTFSASAADIRFRLLAGGLARLSAWRLTSLALLLPCSLLLALTLHGCDRQGPADEERVTLVFKHGKIAGDAAAFTEVLKQFERENPDIRIRDETLPATTDQQHQFYVINLEGKSSDFDVFSMDVIWVPELARAGWLMDLTHMLPPEERSNFFPGPMEAVTYEGRVYAVPWYIDAGVLYYRSDLLEEYGFQPPTTWQELVRQASAIVRDRPDLYGFIWQGKQYEGLICNALEYMWSNGGDVVRNGTVLINSPENREALSFMSRLISEEEITPAFVTTAIEETTRHIFGNGKAVFMRNWPYAWNIFERPGSQVRGKVGVALLPSFSGHEPASTLGGWQLGINKYSRHPKEAERFIEFLTSYETQKRVALTIGYKPTRKSLYRDAELMSAQPFIVSLYDVFEHARPRPVTPYYMMISQILQPEFSAILSRIKKPEAALRSAEKQIQHVLRAEE